MINRITTIVVTLAIVNIFALPTLAQEQNIGTDQDNHDSRLFLQMSTVLLKPGEKAVSISMKYTSNEQNLPFLKQTASEASIATTFRIALSERIEISATVPFSRKERERDSYVDMSRSTKDATGLGDISFRVKFVLVNQGVSNPEIVGSVGVVIPTNNRHYSSDVVATGLGHYSASLGIMAIKSIDPVTIFGGISYTQYFDREFNGRYVERDGSVGYNFGFGFGLNHRLTLSSEIVGSVSKGFNIDSKTVPFSDRKPVLLKNSLTYAWDEKITINSLIMSGLNDDTPGATLGFSIDRRF